MPQIILAQDTSRKINEQRERLMVACKGAKSLSEAYSALNREQFALFYDGKPPDHEGWNAFYKWHSDAVKRLTKNFSGSVCVLGAGPCNDTDLEVLADKSSKVVLVDMDEAAPALARDRLPAILRDKVSVVRADASGFVEDFVAKAEKLIDSMTSAECATGQVLKLLSSYKRADITPMPLEPDSMDLVLSCDAVSNILGVPLHYIQLRLSEKFGPGHDILDPSEDLFAMGLAAPFYHFTEAQRLLSKNGVFAVSACSLYATLIHPENADPEILYGFKDKNGGFVMASMPKFGYLSGRHISLTDLISPYSRLNGLIPVCSDHHAVPLAAVKRIENTPVLGDIELYPAAFYEFMAFMRERIWPGKQF